MTDLIYRFKLRMVRDVKRLIYRPLARYRNPFEQDIERPLIIHRCYHKVGTVWFGRILREVAAEFGLSFGSGLKPEVIKRYEKLNNSDIFLDLGSHVKLHRLCNYRGSHMIRDPRDLIISAYFYHKWTREKWANVPLDKFGKQSYKDYLNKISIHEGLLREIEQSGGWINRMARWSFEDGNIFEMKYEDIVTNEQVIFNAMFRHYGFTEAASKRCCEIAKKYSQKTLKSKGGGGERSHMRSGYPKEWKKHFNTEHIQYFKKLYPGVLEKLGYEKNDDWE